MSKSLCGDLRRWNNDGNLLAVSLSGVDLLAGLGDLLEDGLVLKSLVGGHISGLVLERDFVGLDACMGYLN
jgi:hypothetical protein